MSGVAPVESLEAESRPFAFLMESTSLWLLQDSLLEMENCAPLFELSNLRLLEESPQSPWRRLDPARGGLFDKLARLQETSTKRARPAEGRVY